MPSPASAPLPPARLRPRRLPWLSLFDERDDAGADDGQRGPEKHRLVLASVRQRPDELRPWAP